MANIALVTSSTAGVRNSNRDLLQSLGHTVTVIPYANLTSTDFSGYDLVYVTYIPGNNRVADGAKLRAVVDAGIPLAFGMSDPEGARGGATGPTAPTEMGLTGDIHRFESVGSTTTHSIVIVDNNHPITSSYPLGVLRINQSAEYWGGVLSGQPFVGDMLAQGGNSSSNNINNSYGLIAIESGTNDLNTNPIGARAVLYGGMHGTNGYTTDGAQIIENIVDWLLTPATPPAAEIAAETLLELTASATIEAPAPASIAAATYLQLTTGLTLETPAHIAAAALLQLTATTGLNTQPYTLIQGAAILQLVATADVQQEHRVTAETLLQLVATANIAVDSATTIAAAALLQLVATAETATAHHVRPEALLQLVAITAVAQDHLVRGVALLQLIAHEGYTGPGTGIVVPGQRFNVNNLREGDTFNVFLPWAGLEGMGGIAHVMSRTASDDKADQDVALSIVPHDTANVARLAGGATPTPEADSTDYARKQARQGREIDRIERTRNR